MKALILLLFTVTFSISQAQLLDGNNIYFKLGYFSPTKDSFQKNYDQNFFISDISFPLSVGFGVSIPYKSNYSMYFEINKIQSQLKSNDKIHLNQIPFSLGLTYTFSPLIPNSIYRLYVGSSVNFYWSYLSSEYLIYTETGSELGIANKEFDHYFGYGITFQLGMPIFKISRYSGMIDFSFDINKNGNVEEGGLGNIGGLLIGLKMGINI